MTASNVAEIGFLSSLSLSREETYSDPSQDMEDLIEEAAWLTNIDCCWELNRDPGNAENIEDSLVKRARLKKYKIWPKGEVRVYQRETDNEKGSSYRIEYVRGPLTDQLNDPNEIDRYFHAIDQVLDSARETGFVSDWTY